MNWLYCQVLCLMLSATRVQSGGHGSLRLIKYSNPTGTGDNGNCCDSIWRCYGNNQCDHFFVICIDKPDGSTSTSNCAFMRKITGSTLDTDTITFGSIIGGVPNPFTFKFQRWFQDGVRIKVDVFDEDGRNHDFVQHYNQLVNISPGQKRGLYFSGRTTMTAELLVACDEGWYGPECRVHCVPQNGELLGHYNCSNTGELICHTGWGGASCRINVNDCESYPCGRGGVCRDAINAYSCDCHRGYTGTNCEIITDKCVTSPCENGGSCNSHGSVYECSCTPGYTGANCEVVIDACISEPCQNNGTCLDNVTSFSCLCTSGYEGAICNAEIDECASSPCANGDCIDGFNEYHCQCHGGWTGLTCDEDIPECITDPCLNNGTCIEGNGNYSCACPEHYGGENCQVNIESCLIHACANGSTCLAMNGSHECACAEGMTGVYCEDDVDECRATPCGAHGDCMDKMAAYECICDDGYTGQNCETESDPCVSATCLNGGTCKSLKPGYYCTCLYGYTGAMCESELVEDPCANHTCGNGGTCRVDGNLPICDCTEEYRGAKCEEPTSGHSIYVDTDTDSSDNYETVQFQGQLDVSETELFLSVLVNLTAAELGLDWEALRVVHDLQYCHDSNSDDITVLNVQFETADGRVIARSAYEDIVDNLSNLADRGILPQELYYGECYDMSEIPMGFSKQNWTEKNWTLLVAIGVIVVVVAFGIGIGVCQYKRCRKNKAVYNMNPDATYDARSSECTTDSAHVSLTGEPGDRGGLSGFRYSGVRVYPH